LGKFEFDYKYEFDNNSKEDMDAQIEKTKKLFFYECIGDTNLRYTSFPTKWSVLAD
jgi:hypothetical protein